jgi:hemin uptake protein HemP
MPTPSDSPPCGPLGRTSTQSADGGAPGGRVQAIASERLFRGAAELHINHGGVMYRLRRTSLGKLILTK